MVKNCWNCKRFQTDSFYYDEYGEYEEIIYLCEKEVEESYYLQFPYDKEMNCFEE